MGPKALVVGYGRMGGFHAKVLRDLGYAVTTVDPEPDRQADHRTLDETAGWYDVAAVAVPPWELRDTAYLLAGTRMLIEKPFALNVPDASMLAAYLNNRGSQVCVGFVERFNPQVRALRALLQDGTLRCVTGIRFTRWNDRPSFDTDLDLRLHDIDLAVYLGTTARVTYDTRDNAPQKTRRIDVTHADGTHTVDLMDHHLSPLHGLWHAFLTDGEYPKPADAIRALALLPQTPRATELAAA